jgi:hypothetical protein
MKYSRFAGVLAAILLLHGCATAQHRRQDYVDERPAISAEIKTAILEGKILPGMTADDVLASWGEPERKTVTYARAGITELWTYLTPIGQFTSGVVILTVTNGLLTGLTN